MKSNDICKSPLFKDEHFGEPIPNDAMRYQYVFQHGKILLIMKKERLNHCKK